jgi:hypothetical protein
MIIRPTHNKSVQMRYLLILGETQSVSVRRLCESFESVTGGGKIGLTGSTLL